MAKKGLTPVPGLHRVVEKDLPLAVKVTGRHLGALAYLVSLVGEKLGNNTAMTTLFNSDGSLKKVIISDREADLVVHPGEYVFMEPDRSNLLTATSESYGKHFRPLSGL